MTPDLVAQAVGLGHRYGERIALEAVDFTLRRGSLVALVGANGAGKSTLLELLAGRRPVQRGELLVFGQPPGRGQRHRVTFSRQRPALDPEMSVLETLRFFAALVGAEAPRVARTLRAMGLQEHRRQPAARLSGGLRQRLHLALDLLRDAPLQLFDEPTAGLDRQGRRHFWQELAGRCRDGITAVVASHDLEAMEARADEVLLLHRGRLLAHDEPRRLGREEGCPTLAARLGEGQTLPVDELEGLPGVAFADAAGGRLVLALEGASAAAQTRRALDALAAAHGARIVETSERPPDLLSAVLRLGQQAPGKLR